MGDDKHPADAPKDIGEASRQMADDMPSETEDALDRSLAVQGEPDVTGADEEE